MFYMEGNLFLFSLYNTHNVFWWDALNAVTFLELISMSMSHTGVAEQETFSQTVQL